MKNYALLLVALPSICLCSFTAQAGSLTICNTSDISASAIFVTPHPPGYSYNLKLGSGACTQATAVPDGNYEISLYHGTDCFRPVTVSGNTIYTFDQPAQNACAQRQREFDDLMWGDE